MLFVYFVTKIANFFIFKFEIFPDKDFLTGYVQ